MVSSRIGKQSGFTLVEIMTVVGILGLLFMIVLPNANTWNQRQKETKLRGVLKQMRQAVWQFKMDTGVFPLALSDLAATSAPASGYIDGSTSGSTTRAIVAGRWHGPYVTAVPVDPVTGGALSYTYSSLDNRMISSTSSATASDGTVFSTW